MKLFDQLKPMEFLSNIEPPGYIEMAINIKIKEMTTPIKTAYFLII